MHSCLRQLAISRRKFCELRFYLTSETFFHNLLFFLHTRHFLLATLSKKPKAEIWVFFYQTREIKLHLKDEISRKKASVEMHFYGIKPSKML